MKSWLDEKPKSKQLSDAAKRLVKEKGILLSDALIQASRENPELAEAARWEVMGLPPPKLYDGSGRDGALARMARKRASEKNCSYAVALDEISQELPELARAAREAVLGTRVTAHGSASSGRLGGANQQLADMATERAEKKGIPYAVALSEVAREYPQLAADAREETLDGGQRTFTDTSRPRTNELHQKALARATEKNISYGDALAEIDAENPGLVRAARAEGGLQIKDVKKLENGLEVAICNDTELGSVSDPSGWVATMARNRAKSKGIGYREALAEIARDYPRLARAAHDQPLRG